jgi:hypothetical protein
MREIWKPIPGYEGFYKVSNLGKIKSIARIARSGHSIKERILSLCPDKKGRLLVNLYKDGIHHKEQVSTLVALTFLGPRPFGMLVCHWDDDKTNNCASNLRYDTPKANAADKYRNGHGMEGSKHHNHKLKETDVLEIKRLLSLGYSGSALAREYKVTPATISGIKSGKAWAWLTQ